MEQDKEVTEVIFRFDKTYGVYALFPYNPYNYGGALVDSYAHVGQHSGADYNHCINTSRPATEAEYQDLFNELENGVGYKLRVVKKRNFNKFYTILKEYRLR